MTQVAGRTIYKRGDEASVGGLLQTVFAAEMVCPSRALWVVSPWLSDVVVLDNRRDAYRHLEPQWPRAHIRLGRVLATLAARGTHLVLATSPPRAVAPTEGQRVTDRFVEDLARQVPTAGHLRVYRNVERLHTKGLLGDRYFVMGSMNFTYSGVTVNEEAVRFTTVESEVSDARIEFRDRWSPA